MLDFGRRFFVSYAQIFEAYMVRTLMKFGCAGRKSATKSSARKTPKVHLYEIDVKKYGFQNRKLILKTPLHSKWRQQAVMTIAQF